MRRTISLVAILVTVSVLYVVAPRTRAAERTRPNFIFINIDDLGYADIEPFGSKLNRTPHLNRMAKEGRKLTCFYAAPVCSPSRASLMTGCYPKRALSIPHVLFPGNSVGLDQREITVAELLREQGYATGIIGKWHLGDQPEFLPRRQGFDYYYGLPYSNDMGPASDGVKSNLGVPLPQPRAGQNSQPPLPLLRNETVLQRVLADDQQAIVERYTQEAVAFLHAHRDEPFFLYLPHSAVHFPLYPGKAFHGKSRHGLFGDWVEEVDWSVGQVLQTVRQLGLEKNTMVIFTSDNGGQPRHGAVNDPLRGGKGTTFEGGMRVPTIAWWPGRIPADSKSDQVTSTMDILPTLIRLAGGSVPADRKIDGGDIWPILAGDSDARTPHETFLFFRGLNLEAIRHGDWKLHLNSGELHNLAADISEAKNVAADNADVVAMLRELAEQVDADLGTKEIGPGCRPLGKVEDAQPLIAQDGKVRAGFEPNMIHAGQGIMIGEVTGTSAIAQVRLTSTDRLENGDVPGIAGLVRFSLRSADSESDLMHSEVITADAKHDFIARHVFRELKPNTQFLITASIGSHDLKEPHAGPSATFRTLPGSASAESVSFVVVTGMNYAKFHGDNRIDEAIHLTQNNTELPKPYAGPDKHLGYPALDAIRRLKPDFFVGTGDNVYYDTPKEPRAQTVPELRQKWHEQFVQPRYRDLFASVPTYWMIDDHDYRIDDGDNTGDHLPSPETARQMMLEQLPYGAMDDDDVKTFRTHRLNRDVQIWFTENRTYRSPNAMKDGPEKSIWGKAQREWLQKSLSASNAKFKLLLSPNPMIGPDDARKSDNHTNFGGFRHERDSFFAWLIEAGITNKQFFIVCGDRHWQYHSVHPTGYEEFSCGALVDANSRPGRKPGDDKSTDPKGLIRQPYLQATPSGGFLQIESTPAGGNEQGVLTFQFRDEHSVVLHTHRKGVDPLNP